MFCSDHSDGEGSNWDGKPGRGEPCQEPYNEMQSAISSYTTAQVAPSDGNGFSNASLIKMACRSDGRLLQPSAPARAIDASFALSGGPEPRVKNVHAIMATHTKLELTQWAQVLVIGLNASFNLTPAHLAGEISPDDQVEHLVWSGYQQSNGIGKAPPNITLRQAPFSAAAPITIQKCGYSDFGLYQIAPIFKKSGAAFLGEIGKWVPVSAARVSSVREATEEEAQVTSLVVEIVGEASEPVELAFAKKGSAKPVTVLCKIPAAGVSSQSPPLHCDYQE